MYAIAMLDRPQRVGAYAAVNTLEDLQFLIKEGELLSGSPGRQFVLVINGTRRVVHATFDGTAYGVSEGSSSAYTQWMLEEELLRSPLGEALRAGQLFAVDEAER